MRGARWFLVAAILAILGGVAVTYSIQRRIWTERAPAIPQPLPRDTAAYAPDWCLTKTSGERKVAEICAEYTQQRDSTNLDLKNVTLKLYRGDGSEYDLVKSPAASLNQSDNGFFADGQVEITLGVPETGPNGRRLVSIKTSGVRYNVETGKAETDRPSSFVFEAGEGKSTGAVYDPVTREVLMKADAQLNLNGGGPNAKPTRIEAGSLTYREQDPEIRLIPWGRVTRGESVVEGQNGIVRLQEVTGKDGRRESLIRHVEADSAHGSDALPNRKLTYAAGKLYIEFDEHGVVNEIKGQLGAEMKSSAGTGDLTVHSDEVLMSFATATGESVLDRVNATGNASVTSKPAAQAKTPAETRVMKSQKLEMKMRPRGREMATLTSPAQGTLEFFPNSPAQHHRTLDGKNILITYAADNALESFRADDAKTQTDPTDEERKRGRKLAITTSRELLARFDASGTRLASMEQTGDFTYDEGDRRARAAKGTLDSAQSVITLQTGARVWDSTGSVTADTIRLNQNTGDFTAEGRVNSSRLPEKEQKTNSGLLTSDQPLQAQAAKMISTNRNRSIHYEGNALLWQGANRVQADAINLDREKRTLEAIGNVTSNLWEQPDPSSGAKPKTPSAPVLTVVRSQRLFYTDSDRLAHYTGKVNLSRTGLNVKSDDLLAYLTSGADSRLEKGIAEGSVEIVQTISGRKRTGTGAHAEYYTADQKIVLKGSKAKMVDSVKGSTEGAELTYYANDDRLQVSGTTADPVKSRINRSRP